MFLASSFINTANALTKTETTHLNGFEEDISGWIANGQSSVSRIESGANDITSKTDSYHVALSGAGSLENETSVFGNATKSTLIRFQKANGITPAVGYFGPVTREFMKSSDLSGLWW